MYEYGISSDCYQWDKRVKKDDAGLFVAMSLAKGKNLSEIDIRTLKAEKVYGISLFLLGILKKAQEVLGPSFEHFDFHPDNIFVELDKCARVKLDYQSSKYNIESLCPEI